MSYRTHHSRMAVVAYHDLLQQLLDAEAAEIRGTIETRERNGRRYLYDRYRVGTDVVSRYIGEDRPELRQRIARAEELRDREKERAAERTRLVRVLRAEGFYPLDAGTGTILSAFAKSGVFRLGGTLVGTAAFALYEGELGLRVSSGDLAQTGDLDIASFTKLSVALDDHVTQTPGEILADLDFEPVPGLDRGIWRWRQTVRDLRVEFLTPAFGEEGLKGLPALGVSAQALHYLNYLIAEPIPAVALYRSGILVQIPRPERYAIHKLIVADRRRRGSDASKARKDRFQAAFLIEALAEERPDELREAYEDALSRGPKWRERIGRSLGRMPEALARLAALG